MRIIGSRTWRRQKGDIVRKKMEFSKKWLVACIVLSTVFTAASYILAAFDKNPVETLSASIIETLWGASGISFVGYALQNSVRAYTASRFGLPVEDNEAEAEPTKLNGDPPKLSEILSELDEKRESDSTKCEEILRECEEEKML